jgi:hypothetical protein
VGGGGGDGGVGVGAGGESHDYQLNLLHYHYLVKSCRMKRCPYITVYFCKSYELGSAYLLVE